MHIDNPTLKKMLQATVRLLSLALLCLLAGCDTGQSSPPVTPVPSYTGNCVGHSTNPVNLFMDYSTEKQTWMEAAVASFNQQHFSACDGPITVKTQPDGSGDGMQNILSGSIQPDIWSPAGNVWLTLMNQQWQQKHSGTNIIGTSANENPSLVKSPVVIAMWKPMAQALGWPQKALGWSDIAALSTNAQGWATYGHPEWGTFKFGHTNPDSSNSGLDAVIAENYAASSKVRGLSIEDVNSASTSEFVANVESSIIHYGESTGTFATEMFQKGPNYLSAAIMYENLVVSANESQQTPRLAYPVVAIYPKEGTFYSDHPFAILNASWVTPAKKAAAEVFRDYLLSAGQQQKALQDGFRPANGVLSAPLDQAHGIDPQQPATLLQIPDASVINAIEASWNQQKRKVDVMLIIDRSGSMNDQVNGATKIDSARQGLSEFVQLTGDLDNIGLTAFSTDENVLSTLSPVGAKRQQLQSLINGITADGSTRLFDTIADQYQSVASFSSKHIKAIVVLTDGEDTASNLNIQQLIAKITPTGSDAGNGVKIFTIAYGDASGNGIDVGSLKSIAQASGGQEYSGTPQNIKQVYLDISKFF